MTHIKKCSSGDMEASRVEDSVIQVPYRVILGLYAGILENKLETTGSMGGLCKGYVGIIGAKHFC